MNEIKKIENFLIQNYSNLGQIENIQLVDHKNLNSKNYFFTTKHSSFLLHNVLNSSKIQKMESMCKILFYCYKNKMKVPEPIKNKKNKFVTNKIFLTKFYSGNHYSGKQYELKDTAKYLALLHKSFLKNKISYNYKNSEKLYSIIKENEIDNILKNIQNKSPVTPFDKLFLKNIDYLKILSIKFNKLSIPQKNIQLIHNDLHPENIIFSQKKLAVILDFGSIQKGNILEDIGFTSYRFASFNSNNISNVKKKINLFIENYVNFNEILIDRELMNLILTKKILSRLSYILKDHYFFNTNLWDFDFKKHIKYLKDIDLNNIFDE
jgi:thiamine kinase-like enzyme